MSKTRQAAATTMTLQHLTDPAMPQELRLHLLLDTLRAGGPASEELGNHVLRALSGGDGRTEHDVKAAELEHQLGLLKAGPLREATFCETVDVDGMGLRAKVGFPDGSTLFPMLADPSLRSALRRGDHVFVDAHGHAILSRMARLPDVGEIARVEALIDGDRVLVSLRDYAQEAFSVSAELKEELAAERVKPGDNVIVCQHLRMALSAVPRQDGFSHYQFLSREPAPDVVVERDIGSPPGYIGTVIEHVRDEMLTPEIHRKYGLRPSLSVLLTGPSGTGKTLSIHGTWRALYELMSEVTGVAVEDLPPRVMHMRVSEIHSKWYSESEKNIDRFFDEVIELAGREYEAPDGTKYQLPLLVIAEEIDGHARRRGRGEEVSDRIQTTLLQRFDPNSPAMRKSLVVFVSTTNCPELVDSAAVRRAGALVEPFGRLGRRSFLAALDKHLRDKPFSSMVARDQSTARRRVMAEVAGWLFAPNGDQGQVEITFVGTAHPVVKHRRDFLTGALVDRAVQRSAAQASRMERAGCEAPGLVARMLIDELDKQIRTQVGQLRPDNINDYVTLPEGDRVSRVRSIPQPDTLHLELQQTANV